MEDVQALQIAEVQVQVLDNETVVPGNPEQNSSHVAIGCLGLRFEKKNLITQ